MAAHTCEWCGAAPAEPYEVEPPVYGRQVNTSPEGKRETVRVLSQRAKMAYACREHLKRFDEQKAQAEERARKARQEKRRARTG